MRALGRPSRPAAAAAVVVTAAVLLAVPVARAAAQVSTAPPPASKVEVERLYRARQDSARRRFTAADVEFMQGMIHHHAQALTMARLAPANGASPQLRVLAARIFSAQTDEIETMQRWLRARGQPVPEVMEMGGEFMAHLPGAHDHAMAAMPGMLTVGEMAALRAARGVAFERLFLAGMIRHHQGAVRMVETLFASDGAGNDEAVYKFASDAQADQSTEIERMQVMLAALDAAGRRP